MNKERTVLEWLNMLPETWEGKPLRKMAIDSITKNKENIIVSNAAIALLSYCSWVKDPLYFDDAHKALQSGTIQLTEPKEEFVWTDELVKECILFDVIIDSPDVNELVEKFKASKKQSLNEKQYSEHDIREAWFNFTGGVNDFISALKNKKK